MNEYISREAAVEKITFLCELREIVCNPDDEFLRGLKNALNAVKSNEVIPSADVQPVKHGRWIDIYEYCKALDLRPTGLEEYYWCSECDKAEKKTSDFCPNCGADMMGG